MNSQPLVSIICATYNQKDYIAQTIESFLMQKVDFPIEIIIHDDASTDGTAEIVRHYADKYPNLIKAILQKENQYSKKIKIWRTYMYPLATGEFIAECEGDDYWTDPNKLQTQIDFLRTHSEYSACVHQAVRYNDLKKEFLPPFPAEKNERDYSIEELILGGGGLFSTNSLVFRSKYNTNEPIWEICPVGDFPQILKFALKGKIHYFPKEMSCYRVFAKGSWTNRILQQKEKRIEFLSGMDRFLESFDEYTDHKYTKAIQKKLDLNHFNLYWDYGMWNNLRKTSHYKERSFIGKMKALYHCFSCHCPLKSVK